MQAQSLRLKLQTGCALQRSRFSRKTPDQDRQQSKIMTNTNYIKPIHLNMSVDDSMHNLLASEKSLEEYSLDIVEHFLNKYNQNVRLVAKKLGIGKSTVYRMLQKKEFTLN